MSGFYRAPITPGQTWFRPVLGGNVPAAGGSITTYLAGSLVLAATFADNTGNTANPTSIVLNSVGGLPNVDVWFPGGVAYKFVILDAAGNPIATVDNLTGENDPAFSSGSFSEWITGPAATWLSGTSMSAPGDQLTTGPWNRDRRVEITSGAGVTRATLTSSVYVASPTNLTTVTFEKDANDPTPTNPITGTRYGILSVPATSYPSAALILGAARRRDAGSTNTLLFGPIGSNLVTFLTPPDVVASAGGAGNQVVTGTVNGVAGSLTFNKTAHGRVTGQAVQVATSNTLPGNVVAATTYIVFVVDANNFGLYAVPAGWQFEQPYLDPLTVPGGLTWGNPLAFSTAGVGNQTVTPGFVAPSGVGRIWAAVTGGGGGGGGSRGNTGDGGAGGNGANSTFMTLTGNFGALGNGGTNAATGGTTSAGGSASGGQLNLPGNRGEFGGFNATGANPGGAGAMSYWGGQDGGGAVKSPGSGGNGGLSTAASQGGGGGGASGGTAISWLTVTPGTWVACTVGAGGTAGTAGTGTGSNPGLAGGAGGVVIEW